MAKDGATFQYGKKVISSDEAIKLIKAHPNSHIRTKSSTSGRTAVIIKLQSGTAVNTNRTDVYSETVNLIKATKEEERKG